MTPFSTYMTALVLLVAGIALAAWLLGVPLLWILVGIVIVLSLAFLIATSRSNAAELPEQQVTPPDTTPPDAA